MADTGKEWADTEEEVMDADRFIGHCQKLNALGHVVGFMGWHENGEDLLKLVGEDLGDIICDYATEIKEAADVLYPVLRDFSVYGGVSLLDRALSVADALNSDPEGYSFELSRVIEKIDELMNNDLKKLMGLRKHFQDVVEKRAKEEKTSAKAPGKDIGGQAK